MTNMFIFQTTESNNLYSKIILFLHNKEVTSKKRKCYKTNTMLDFSTEHKFKLGGEALDDIKVKFQIKNSTPLLQKSKYFFGKITRIL